VRGRPLRMAEIEEVYLKKEKQQEKLLTLLQNLLYYVTLLAKQKGSTPLELGIHKTTFYRCFIFSRLIHVVDPCVILLA